MVRLELPIRPPFLPMEAETADELPLGGEWQYEPKWDGFRCVAFRDGDAVQLQSKAGKPLTRYFPELAGELSKLRARRFVLDGEIVIPVGARLSFEDLLLRIHPAATRVNKLARERPSALVVFDLLVDERGRSLIELPLAERRPRLEQFAQKYFAASRAVRLSPASPEPAVAREWRRVLASDLDGLIAKRLDLPYAAGERGGMVKVKTRRTADCVVGGFRYGTGLTTVASLLLGLYDEQGLLQHVGFTSGIRAAEREGLTTRLKKLIEPPGFTGNKPGGPSRWATERSTEWEPLRPELVCEVEYDHFTGGRFRHGTRFVRWRPDKAPRQCTFGQVARAGRSPLALLANIE